MKTLATVLMAPIGRTRFIFFVGALAAAACNRTPESVVIAVPSATAPATPVELRPPTWTDAGLQLPPNEASGGDDSTGVAECDQYLTLFERCAKNLSAAMAPEVRKAMVDGLTANREAIKSATSTPEGKRAMKDTCTQWFAVLAANELCQAAHG